MKVLYKVHSVRSEPIQKELTLEDKSKITATVKHSTVEMVPVDGESSTITLRTVDDPGFVEGAIIVASFETQPDELPAQSNVEGS